MELTKEKGLEILQKISIIENVVSQGNDKFKLNSSLSYCFMRNKLKLKKVSDERDKILEFLREEFDKTVITKEFSKEELEKKLQEDKDYKKDFTEKYSTFVADSEKFKDFIKEKVNIDLYKIKIDKLEGVELPSINSFLLDVAEYLIDEE